ncbi:MAG: FadR family transcriptional regulator [Rhodobacteraceae bacterium]|nr:FadR family transcriptional regulator [Paracoccaceae bacterium]
MDKVGKVFEPIETGSVAESVVHQIEAMIVSGILREGTKLPSERALSELLNVSRPKLREALKQLEKDNLLVVKQGERSEIAPLTGAAMTPAFQELYGRHPSALFDFLEYRREQESFAAGLAAKRATNADKEIITEILAEMERSRAAKDFKAEHLADVQFHSAIVAASNNSTLIHMMASIYQLTKRGVFSNRQFLRTTKGVGQKIHEQHCDIAKHIFNGNAEAASAAARFHLDFVEQSIRTGQERATRERLGQKRKFMMEK